MLSNPLKEEYHRADITINGETFYNVGIRTKGNTSLSQVASSDSERYSFKVKFDKYVNGQSYYGLYLAIEGLQESYLERNYGYDHGNLYKAEGTGTNLKYTGETQSNYSGLKDNAVTSITDDDFQKIIDMIKNLNNGTNLVQKEQVAIYLPYIFLLMSLQAPTCQIAHY